MSSLCEENVLSASFRLWCQSLIPDWKFWGFACSQYVTMFYCICQTAPTSIVREVRRLKGQGRRRELKVVKSCSQGGGTWGLPIYTSSYCTSCWGDRLQKPTGSIVSNRIGMTFGSNVLQVGPVYTRQLTESDFRFDYTFSRWPWGHFAQKSADTWWVHTQLLSLAYAAVSASSWSTVHSYLLIYIIMASIAPTVAQAIAAAWAIIAPCKLYGPL